MLSQWVICSKYSKIYSYLLIIFNVNLIYSQMDADGQNNNASIQQKIIRDECTMKRGNFRCDNGECILVHELCDGELNCGDDSDETAYYCSTINCPSSAFRCEYGACLDKDLKCNGYKDCVDGSDEADMLCGKTEEKNITTTRPTFIPTLPNPSIGCLAQYIPHLHFTFDGTDFDPGVVVESSTTITYRCDPQHFLEGELYNLCLLNQWQRNHPTCTKYCPYAHLKAVTFQADCHYNNTRIPCDEFLRPGTIAKISCQVGYHKPPDFPETLHCGNDGSWDFNPSQCFQSCGEEPVNLIPYIGGGENINVTSVPWQVAIYSRVERNDYEQICGGTILNARVVLSAAHCFYNDSKRETNDRQYYTVAVGKSFRSYTSEKYAQFSNISEIYIPLNYEGIHLKYVNDFALIVLNNDLRFNNYIKPACLQWKDYADKVVQTGVRGRVTGWGETTSRKPSEVLQVLELETLSHKDCVEAIENGEPPTKDKFCVKSPDGAVCHGDSGGGFLVSEPFGNKKRYYIWGVVSHGGTQAASCIDNSLTTFTNIQFFEREIGDFLVKHNPR